MISNKKFKEFVVALPVEEQREVVERQLRVLPQFIMEEVARFPVLPNTDKVIKRLESRLKQVRLMKSALIANGEVK